MSGNTCYNCAHWTGLAEEDEHPESGVYQACAGRRLHRDRAVRAEVQLRVLVRG